jgi:Excreted virulence factor EspC, type VII ESX diderm
MTTMSGGFGLDDDRVQAHAREVEGIAQRVQRVAWAGRHTQQLSDGAFGLIGEVFAVAARQGIADGLRDVTSLADSGGLVARGLDAAVAYYRQAEQRNRSMFDGGHP